MGTGYTLDQQSIQRIAAAVRNYERTRGQGQPPPSRGVSPTKTFWVKLDDEDASHAGHYNWTLQMFVQGNWKDDDSDPVIKDDTNFTAHHANDASGLSGNYVELMFYGFDGDDDDANPIYLFNVGGSLPEGQYQYEFCGMVSQNQVGYMFIPANSMTQGS